jgi:hypothetical protein
MVEFHELVGLVSVNITTDVPNVLQQQSDTLESLKFNLLKTEQIKADGD